MSIGVFQLVKNEQAWVGTWLKRLLPVVDRVVIYDGNSTDGTLDIIDYCRRRHDPTGKIKLFLGKDPADLRDDYVRLFDACMRELDTDWAAFIHPDMWVANPEQLMAAGRLDGVAMSCRMRSYAGEPGWQLWEVTDGRTGVWKNIFRLRNPDLGAHYWGHYGAADEDVYFRDITGAEHVHHGSDLGRYPYDVLDSGLRILHFSDVRPHARRLGRMKTCLRNQGYREDAIDRLAELHPRVSLKNGVGFKFAEPGGQDFAEYLRDMELVGNKEFAQFQKEVVHA